MSPTATGTTTSTPTPDPVAALSLEQRVGQLFLAGTPATAAAPGTLADVARLHVGGVFLSGQSTAGAAGDAALVSRFTAADHDGIPLLIATDQEGGLVQRLAGPGFSTIPAALTQANEQPQQLQADAARWGRQLRAAGIDMNLAPVADVVDSPQQAQANPPIGRLRREYGYAQASVLPHARAFAEGMLAAGVVPVAKHFPGLGAVTANTDYSSRVTDPTTSALSPSVAVFRGMIDDGAPAIMLSSAIYSKIAPGTPAPFAPAVVTGLLRTKLGFSGVVMSDDVSATAQLSAWTPQQRAILAIQAGVDIVLVSAAPEQAPAMIAAVIAKARTDPAFAAQVDAACGRVLALKQRYLK
ncbi:glycoside hydrolase family 3 protein [Gryllotalpicola daejeonensis]|uniref:beta-N-acetylhexosaminidase n=1 Tax=Gryllotalpicola daejeonensis TaxID=993087 RepID=A0ABP7ZF36_9MICO